MSAAARPVIFGEVLYDRFEDGSAVLGGAPFNVAWHLQGFGLAPLFISRVGPDSDGAAIRARMRAWGMDVGGLQRDPERPTGQVQVTLAGGEPSYEICADQAYDHIGAASMRRLLAGVRGALLYHGTLAARSAASLAALDACIATGLPVFIDVNLRAPWWTGTAVRAQLRRARWAKLNEEELARVLGWEGVPDPAGAARRLGEAFELEATIVTLGPRGAVWVQGEAVHAGSPPATEVVDTVGAGDAFSAVAIVGLLRGWDAATTLRRALAFASRVCGVRGATLADRAFYRAAMEGWDHGDAAG